MQRNSSRSDTSPGTRKIHALIVSPPPLAVHHAMAIVWSLCWVGEGGVVELWWVWWRLANWLAGVVLVVGSSSSSTLLDTTFSLVLFTLVVLGPAPRI